MSTKTEQRACDKHGQYEAAHLFASHWTACPACQSELEEGQRRRDEERKRGELASRKQALIGESGIVGRYLTATFGSFDATTKEQRRVLQACREFADTFHREQGSGLWLIGPPGTGKTHLGCAIARAVIEQHARGALIASARDILRRLRDTWRRGAEETEAVVIEEYGWVSLLVLDEVGAGFGSEAEQVQLFDVIDKRYTLKRPTVLLSNLNQPLLRTVLGDRSFDRLREGAKVLVCDWPSHRGSVQ
jgi:DNA replication protein DnaC